VSGLVKCNVAYFYLVLVKPEQILCFRLELVKNRDGSGKFSFSFLRAKAATAFSAY